MPPNFERARQYVLNRLERELSPHLYYHNVVHTRDDVLPAANRLARLSRLSIEESLLLQTAALYHDIGFIENRKEHETISVRIATQTLPDFGYTSRQIDTITETIMATRIPQTPTNLLGQYLADADLDVLGRNDDFWEMNTRLRAELTAIGIKTSDETWYIGQLDFLRTHTYFTETARALRSEGKQLNINKIEQFLSRL